jgi:DNA-binding transcriptional ArsR family regulator
MAIRSDTVSEAVTPDELLRSLLDSRGQPATLAENRAPEPTRIRALEALRNGELTVRVLADRIEVTRQTAYRALEPLQNAGLTRAGEAGVGLSCSGAAVIRIYREICEEIDSGVLIQLARSEHKQWVLRTLNRVPSRKAALATRARREGGPSRTTIHRVLTVFTKESYARERAGACELTDAGRHLLEAYTRLRTVVEQALDKREIFRWLPSTLEPFPIAALDGAKIIQNTPEQPHNVLSAFTRCVGTDVGIFRWISTIACPALVAVYRPFFENSRTDARVVFPETLLPGFTVNQVTEEDANESEPYLGQDLTAPNTTLRSVRDPPLVHLAICDDTRVIMSPAPSSDVTAATAVGIESADPLVVDWATRFFESTYATGRSPDGIRFQRAHSHDPS